jgi:hypothetical protein
MILTSRRNDEPNLQDELNLMEVPAPLQEDPINNRRWKSEMAALYSGRFCYGTSISDIVHVGWLAYLMPD